ncbi:restriction endonuclease subunit R [Rathayibacter sp. AY1F3]|uniref:restriction endonuclease subunit R n=1 Tax=Rathayibacter sp. AY1F3 TaxID=2080558 RepID=UPI000CE7E7D5|nr:restriction endonuclease subunit R [Rathayibacter sp. AY1F3]PPG92780.1 restriction endonuclease subunit R [Rathayibacter sp. AY1F3]
MTDAPLPAGWTFAASTFNWTVDLQRADRSAAEIVAGIGTAGIVDVVELEAGQVLRSFPAPTRAESEGLAERLAEAGVRVDVFGASLDDFVTPSRRRTHDERLAFLLPQLRAARWLGARSVRLPLGQAGRPLLEALLPHLHELDLVLQEEIQGQQAPARPDVAAALETIAALDDPRLRLAVDVSLLMPALPTSYLARLAEAGLPADFVSRLADDWTGHGTGDEVVRLLRSGAVPPHVHVLYMDLLIRFGRTSPGELIPLLPLAAGVHLKFWDLDDRDGRVTAPLESLAPLLLEAGFQGTLTSEWGGHEWLPEKDPDAMTREHLRLAAAALTRGLR